MMKKILFALLLVCSQAFAQYTGNVSYTGQAAFGGTYYDHVVVSAGNGPNPLTAYSQVGFWTFLTCNSYATAHCGGFEASNGLDVGATTSRMDAFTVANPHMGSGSSATQWIQFGYSEAQSGVSNAVIAPVDDHTFTGNWFINDRDPWPSVVMGDFGFGRAPDSVPNSRVISLDGPQKTFIRLYVNGIENSRITATATDTYIDNYGTGSTTFRTRNGTALVLNVDGSITMPQLAGSGTRAVYVDGSGNLSAH